MLVLGINCFHANSSVCFVENGHLIYAMEEERVNRINRFWVSNFSIRKWIKLFK